MMLGARGHEEAVAGLEWIALVVVKEDALAPDDDVDLVLLVRSLSVRRHGKGKLHVQRTALQEADGVLARGARDPGSSVREPDHAATIVLTQSSLPCPRPVSIRPGHV